MRMPVALAVAALLLSIDSLLAADLSVAELAEPAPTDDLSPEVAGQLSPTGWKVTSGPNRTVCDLWFVKSWPVKAGFKPTSSVLYPFEVGQLIGVVKFRRKAGDFRNQEIPAGLYT